MTTGTEWLKREIIIHVSALLLHQGTREREQADALKKTYIFTRNTHSSSNFKEEYLTTSVSSSWWFLQLQVFLLHGWFIQQNSWSDKESFWNPWSGQEWFHWRRGAAVSTVQLLYFFKQQTKTLELAWCPWRNPWCYFKNKTQILVVSWICVDSLRL